MEEDESFRAPTLGEDESFRFTTVGKASPFGLLCEDESFQVTAAPGEVGRGVVRVTLGDGRTDGPLAACGVRGREGGRQQWPLL